MSIYELDLMSVVTYHGNVKYVHGKLTGGVWVHQLQN